MSLVRISYSKNFKEENADALLNYDNARKYFDEYKAAHGIEKLPTMQELKEEYAKLKEIKSFYYHDFKALKKGLAQTAFWLSFHIELNRDKRKTWVLL
jgi:hypothetical protein